METSAATGTAPHRGRAILARAVLLAVGLALLIVGAAILLLGLSLPFDRFFLPNSPFGHVVYHLRCATAAPVKRTTNIVATDTTLAIQIDLALPRDLPCAQAIQDDIPNEYRTLVERAIGPIVVDHSALSPPRDHPSDVSVDSATGTVHMRVDFRQPMMGARVVLDVPGPRPDVAVRPSRDSLHVALDRMRASIVSEHGVQGAPPGSGLAFQQLSREFVAVDSTPDRLVPYELELFAVSSSSRTASITPAGEVLGKIGNWDVPGLSELLGGFAAALPLLLLIWVVADAHAQGTTRRIADVSTSLVVLVLAVAVMSALSRVTFTASDEGVLGAIEMWRRQHSMTFLGREVTGSILYFVAPVLAVLFSGALIREGSPYAGSIKARRLSYATMIGVLLIGIAFDIFLFASSPVPGGAWQVAALLVATATIWVALALLSAALWPSVAVGWPIAGTVAAIFLFALIDRYQMELDPWLQITIWFTITAAVGLATVTALWLRTRSLLSYGLSTLAALVPAPTGARRVLRTLVIALLIVGVLPLGLFLRHEYLIASYFHAGLPLSVINAVLWYVYPLWIACVLVALYADGNASIRAEPGIRAITVIAAASAVFPTSQGWLAAWAAFLVGIASLWLLTSGTDYERSFALPVDEVLRQRCVRALRRLRGAELSSLAFRRKQYDSYVKGDIDGATYDRTVAERFDQLDTLGVMSKIDGHDPRDISLAMPLYASAWRNGKYGARWSFLASFPWIALGVISILRHATDPAYPLIAIEGGVFRIIIKWASIGFLFGYLFPYIRGRSGLAKGLSLSVAIGAVYILGALPIASSADWQASVFLATQILILCLVLGLGFDFVALRRAGERDWRVLFELHGIPAVGASISSILVAAGGSVVALLTQPSLVHEVIRLLFPKLPAALFGGSP